MRLIPAIACFCASGVLMGLTCPSPEPPFPHTLESPAIDSMALGWSIDQQGGFHPSVCLKWVPPPAETISISSFVVLRKRVGLDAQFSVNLQSIPADTTVVRISIEDILSQTGADSAVYRVYAIDSLGRPGDTSATWTLLLSTPPTLEYPPFSGYLDSLFFRWSVSFHSYSSGFLTYMAIVNAGGYFWQSPVPAYPALLGEAGTWDSTITAPVTLPAGGYHWIVLVDDYFPVANTFMGSIGVQPFYVP